MDLTSPPLPESNPHPSEADDAEWTPRRIAALVMLAVLCGILVWNAYSPEDIFLSDLKYEVPLGDRMVPLNDRSVEGNTITIDKTYYPKGIGVHANSEISYRFLPTGYRYFVAEVGIDAEVPADSPASAVFSVFSDGTLMYESPVMKPGMPPRFVRVCIDGRHSIVLKVSDAGDGIEGDHADWAMARFVAR
ncbi:MAG TPA: NPCBM/NEW2 domain-containing protein [bacterium]|nr:NPCBM/NEW2 domain-containing protein [bacterium]